MTDDRTGGGVPPGSGSAAPPPLATNPPPAAPHYPPPPQQPPHQPQPPYYPPPPKSKTGLWILGLFLAFAVGVGGTLLVLYLSDEIVSYRSSSYPAPSYGSRTGTGTGTGTIGGTPAPPPPPPTTGAGYAPTAETLAGSWGPGCPGNRAQTITFYPDGTAASDGESGTWTLNGNYVNMVSGRGETMVLYWEMLSSDTARVRRSGAAESRVINRCP